MSDSRRMWDVNAFIHVEPSSEEIPLCVHGKLRIIVHEDRSWVVSVKRDNQTFDLLLIGPGGSATGSSLNEILSWLFGVAA